MQFRNIGVALAALATTLTLAACEVPEEETGSDLAAVTEAEPAKKQRKKDKPNKGGDGSLKQLCEGMGGSWDKSAPIDPDDPLAPCAGLPGDESEPETDNEPSETLAQREARESAESYLDTGDFSRSGLIDQLEFEEYSKAVATYAVDQVKVNWRKEAAESAESYMDSGSFSAPELADQLEFEGFTDAQVAYGVRSVGY